MNPKVHIRRATPAGFPRIAEIGSQAFKNDDFQLFLFPNSPSTYARDTNTYWYQFVWDFMFASHHIVAVAEIDSAFAGLAVWECVSDHEPSPELGKSSVSAVARRVLAKAWSGLWNLRQPMMASSDESLKAYHSTVELVLKTHFHGEYREHWHCWRLATHPEFEYGE